MARTRALSVVAPGIPRSVRVCTPRYPTVRHLDLDTWSSTGYTYGPLPRPTAPHGLALLGYVLAPLADLVASFIAPADRRLIVKASLVRGGGYAGAGLLIFSAVLANHVRRVLLPSVGQFVSYHAVENMRLARSSPYHFLEASLAELDWLETGLWALAVFAVATVKEVLVGDIVEGEIWHFSLQQESRRVEDERLGRPREVESRATRAVLDLQCAAYLAICLVDAEYAFTKACWAASHIYAYARLLLMGGAGPTERKLVAALVSDNKLRFALQFVLLLHWAHLTLVPRAGEAIRAALRGQLALPGFYWLLWASTAHVVRYSNYYFVALEGSDLVVTLAWAAVAATVLGLWKGQDVWKGGRVGRQPERRGEKDKQA